MLFQLKENKASGPVFIPAGILKLVAKYSDSGDICIF